VVNRKLLGELGEQIAAAFLRVKGYSIVAKNYRYSRREIDLIARKENVLAAVEVKLRRGDRFGGAIEAVDSRKIARLHTALEGFLRTLPEPVDPRIDLVVIDLSSDSFEMKVRHIEGIC
jgi:putative endonuclease